MRRICPISSYKGNIYSFLNWIGAYSRASHWKGSFEITIDPILIIVFKLKRCTRCTIQIGNNVQLIACDCKYLKVILFTLNISLHIWSDIICRSFSIGGGGLQEILALCSTKVRNQLKKKLSYLRLVFNRVWEFILKLYLHMHSWFS